MAYQGYKVPSVEVKKNDLAFVNNKLSQYGMVPNTVIAGWSKNPNLNVWQKELLEAGQDASRLPYDDATVGVNTRKAVTEYLAFRAGKPGKKQRVRVQD